MKKYLPIAIIGGIVLILIIWLAAGYNGMNSASLEVDESWANVQSQYQRRKDLIPNLEATVKKYAEHESKTFTAVTEARAGVDKSQQAVNSLPKEIPSDEQQMVRDLQTQLEGTENRIQVARANYNETVKKYNKKVTSFPNVLISGMFGFQKHSSFQADADAATAPKVFDE